jgi:Amiloride-sensitive sodium channel
LPSCKTIIYEADRVQYTFKRDQLSHFNQKALKNEIWSKLRVYFIEPEILASHRTERFGFTVFLANCGGLFGKYLKWKNADLLILCSHRSFYGNFCFIND